MFLLVTVAEPYLVRNPEDKFSRVTADFVEDSIIVIVSVFQLGFFLHSPMEEIPVKMTVVGCPLSFQMTAAQPDLKPIVRYGFFYF